MGKMDEVVFHTYYHDERIVGGKNICYYAINHGEKIFLTLLSYFASSVEISDTTAYIP
jgi:hypothetical protein